MASILKGQHITSAEQYTREALDELITTALHLRDLDEKHAVPQVLAGRLMAPLFFENSTRTFSSFVGAFQKLGGGVINLSLENSSLASKGETLDDTIRTVDYCDVIALRHPKQEALQTAVSAARHVRILNAGNGTGEHPSQALLDAVTMTAELGKIDGAHVVLLGDLKNGRTVHSLAKLLTRFNNISFTFVAPASLQMPEYVTDYVKAAGFTVSVSEALTPDIISRANVVYVTRVQKERFASEAEYEAVKGSYCVNAAALAHAKPAGQMCVLHPLPRNEELTTDIDEDPRAAYFRQMRYGLYARMALILAVLDIKI